MKVNRHQLAQVIARQPRAASPKAVAAYLLQANQTNELAPLMRDVVREWISTGTLEVVAVSARPLSQAVLRDTRVTAKRLYPAIQHIIITQQLDPTLVGGARIQIGDYELDLSVQGQLSRFRSIALKGSA